MKILVLNWRDPKHPLAGGAEEMVFHHASYWKSKGAEVTWLSSAFKNGKSNETVAGINILRIGSQYSVHLLFLWKYMCGQYKDFDIYVDCFHFIPFFTPLFTGKKKKLAIIHEIAGTVWFKNIFLPIALIGIVVEKFSFLLYRKMTFITVSNSTKKDLMRHFISLNQIKVINNGIDVVRSRSSKNKDFTLMYLGRISEDKGIDDALWVYKKINETKKEVKMYICGKEEFQGQLSRRMEKIGIQKNENIKYFGFVPTIKKFDLLKKSSVLIHPSLKEGWGLSVIEAGSQYTPTVGYKVAGLIDSVDNGRTGVLVSSKKEMLVAVESLMGDKKKLNTLSTNAYRKSQNFRWRESVFASWDIIRTL